MGGGKTVVVYSALDILDMAGFNFFPVLVIAPLRVARDVWPAEARKWDHTKKFKVVFIHGTTMERRRLLHQKADIYTINYENIPWLVEEWGNKWPYLTIVCDEATRLKGFRLRTGTKRAAALAQIARKTERWINLTGTPSPNGLKDLWGQNWFLDFGKRLGLTWTDFKIRWFDSDQYAMTMEPKMFAQDQIQDAIHDVTMTVNMRDFISVKEPIVQDVMAPMPIEAMRKYRQFEKKMFVELKAHTELNATTAASLSIKCLQFCSGAAYYGENGEWEQIHDAKLDALESIIEETAGANVLVFYNWKHDLARIQKRFPHIRVLKDSRDEQDWNKGKISLMAAHPASAGHGLNLQDGGHHMVHFSLWWDAEKYLQANERMGPLRQMQSGYDRNVFIYRIIVPDTLEIEVVNRLTSKISVQESLLNAMKRHERIAA